MPDSKHKQEPIYRAVILTALTVEYQAVRAHLSELREEPHPRGTLYERGTFAAEGWGWDVLLVEVGHGNPRAALETERAIEHFDPHVALFVGIAGGLKDVALGDVVIASKVYSYESGKVLLALMPRPDTGEVSYALEQRARFTARSEQWLHRISEATASKPRAWIGAIASGEKVLAETDSQLHLFLRTQYGDALAVEMEGRGFLVSTHASQDVHALVVRGISDLIDDKAEREASGSKEVACRHASAFVFELLSRFRPPAKRSSQQDSSLGGRDHAWSVPYQRNLRFTGRNQVLEEIHSHFSASSPLPLALTGLGGVGKTQLAVEYAFRHAHEERFYSHVLWVHANEPSVLAAGYAALAGTLGLPERQEREHSQKVSAVHRWLQQHDRWLLVFDNADHFDVLRPYLPSVLKGHVLITSQNPAWRQLATTLSVGCWAHADSIDFLRKCTHDEDESAAALLAEAMGHLPLALVQAASYIEQTGKSLRDYFDLFEQRQKELLARPGAPPDYPYTVATAWELSFEQVQARSPAGAALLALCAFLAPSPIPTALLKEGASLLPPPLTSAAADELELDEAIRMLLRYSLVQCHNQELLFHRLVQAVMRERLGDAQKSWAGTVLTLIQEFFFFHPEDLRAWARCDVLLPHALSVASSAWKLKTALELLPKLLCHVGHFWGEQAEYELGSETLGWGLAVLHESSVPDPIIEVRIQQSLADIALHTGELTKAQEYLERAWATVQTLPADLYQKLTTATLLNDLAQLLLKRGELQAALDHSERALALAEANLDSTHPHLGQLISTRGTILLFLARVEEAQSYFERSLEISQANFNSAHPKIAIDFQNLAKVFEARGDAVKAQMMLLRALELMELFYGEKHPRVGIVLRNLGGIHLSLGDEREARSRCERALEIHEACFGPEHADVASSLNSLALVHQEQGDLETAATLLARAAAIDERVLGPRHSELATVLTNLGRVQEEQGAYEQARASFERAFAINEHVWGPGHSVVALNLLGLSSTLLSLEEGEQAQELIRRALSILESQNVIPASRFVQALLQVGKRCHDVGEWATAIVILEYCLRLVEVAGIDQRQKAELLGLLGVAYAELDNRERARHLLKEAKQLAEGTGEQKLLADMLFLLGRLAASEGEADLARNYLEQALTLSEHSHGPSSLDVALVHHELAELELFSGHRPAAEVPALRALSIYSAHRPLQAQALASVLSILTGLYVEAGTPEKARTELERAWHILEEEGGVNNESLARVLSLLGGVYLGQGDPLRARHAFERASSYAENAPECPQEVRSFIARQLGRLCHELGDFEAARPQLELLVKLHEASPDPMLPELFMDLLVLARILWEQEGASAALPLADQALEVCESLPAAEVRRLLVLVMRSELLIDLERWHEARASLENLLGQPTFNLLPPEARSDLHDKLGMVQSELGQA